MNNIVYPAKLDTLYRAIAHSPVTTRFALDRHFCQFRKRELVYRTLIRDFNPSGGRNTRATSRA